jgi:hypothetical protein
VPWCTHPWMPCLLCLYVCMLRLYDCLCCAELAPAQVRLTGAPSEQHEPCGL